MSLGGGFIEGFSLTGEDGRYTIKGLPTGEYEVRAFVTHN